MIYGEKKNEKTARLANLKELELKGVGVWVYLLISCVAFASLLYIVLRDYLEQPLILLVFVWTFVPYVGGSIVGLATYTAGRIAGPFSAYLMLIANWSFFYFGYLQGYSFFKIISLILGPFFHGLMIAIFVLLFGAVAGEDKEKTP